MRLFYGAGADKFWQLQAMIDDSASQLVGNVAQPRRIFTLTPYSPLFLALNVSFKFAGQPYQDVEQILPHGEVG